MVGDYACEICGKSIESERFLSQKKATAGNWRTLQIICINCINGVLNHK